MPGLGSFSIGVDSVFLVGKMPILGGLIDVRTWVFARDSGKFFQSRFAQRLSIKVYLKFLIKVRLIRINFSITIMIAMQNFRLCRNDFLTKKNRVKNNRKI
jgi:hypothetical protein